MHNFFYTYLYSKKSIHISFLLLQNSNTSDDLIKEQTSTRVHTKFEILEASGFVELDNHSYPLPSSLMSSYSEPCLTKDPHRPASNPYQERFQDSLYPYITLMSRQ